MKKSPEASPNNLSPKFEEHNIITCPSDLTGTRWKVMERKANGTLIAVVEGGEKYPSTEYPKTIEITPEAQDLWELAK